MKYHAHSPWSMLFFMIALWFGADCLQTKAIDDHDDCKNANLTSLTQQLKTFSQCFEKMLPHSRNKINALAWRVQHVLELLRKVQAKACKALDKCSLPLAPPNGGLVCVTIDHVHYCKPMCNQDYDFGFLRRSRIYEQCGSSTGFSWTTQLVGGNRLAVCNPASTAISGVASAYFPPNVTCWETIADATAEKHLINTFLGDLAKEGLDVLDKHDEDFDCIICGN
ncbi:PREDICTED: uncharacterized protein LOC109287336 [Gavialis gangeticus]|uniref:uncharacterized protein LOC109287336 n=1 Tax=Gavialis gangeticus TaxID=94835 RepID=UPI00092F8C26|nr:PREDICTED: uncharacterized protein LOC109287336 [Gavialis gangeticus]